MFKKSLIALALILAAFAAFVAHRPADLKVTRSLLIDAPPAKVFPLVNDFRLWEKWSPWEKMDPAMRKTFEGPVYGQGSVYSWAGNKKVGEGKMTILQSVAPEFVRIQLEFIQPMAGTSLTEFTFRPQGPGTQVQWTLTGRNNFIAKALGLFTDMEGMVGSDFEKGLAAMKAAAEAAPKKKRK